MTRSAWLALGIVLALVVHTYAIDPTAPGMNSPEGWWGWFDQGKTLASTQAFLHGDLDPAQHWYPLGYSLLAVPFALFTHDHAFLPVNLLSLAAVFVAAQAVGRRIGLPPWAAAAAIGVGLAGALTLRHGWSIPWNTAPAAACAWGLIALCARPSPLRAEGFAIGALAAGLAACRPTDAVTLLPCLALWAVAARMRWRALLAAAFGAALIAAPYALLHVAIYGPGPSPYMVISREIGFTAADPAWRAYVLLIDPVEWFGDGAGLVRRYPWLLAGFAALPLAWRWGQAGRLLAITLLAHLALYVAYVDLLPIGLWRYKNAHYFAWAMPGWALLGARLALALTQAGRWRPAVASLAAVVLLSAVRMKPVPAGPGQPAKMVEARGPVPPFAATYFGAQLQADDRGPLPNISVARDFPAAGGTRVIGLRRWVDGPVRWPGGAPAGVDPAGPQERFGMEIGWGWPRWARAPHVQSVIPE